MKKILLVALAVTLWCGVAHAWRSWSHAAPSGGGGFTCSAVSLSGNVLVGSDNSTIYRRSAPGQAWEQISILTGSLFAEQTYCIAFDPKNPSRVAAATGNGCWTSTNGGGQWTRLDEVNADDALTYEYVTWSKSAVDSCTLYVGVEQDHTNNDNSHTTSLHVYRRAKTATNWTHVEQIGSDNYNAAFTLLAVNPYDSGDLIALTGQVLGSGSTSNQDLWVDPGADGGATQYTTAADTSCAFVGAAFTTRNADDVELVVSTQKSNGHEYVYQVHGFTGTPNWGAPLNPNARTSGPIAVGSNGVYLVSIDDACPRGSPPASAGLWRADTTSAAAFSRSYSGADWDLSWATQCVNAQGKTLDNATKTISEIGWDFANGRPVPGPQPFWTSQSFVYEWSSNKYTQVSTGAGYSGGSWTTTNVDNSNPNCMAVDGSGNLWVGFHDMGLWKYSQSGGDSWTDQSGTQAFGGKDFQGGNITSIVLEGPSTIRASSPPIAGVPYNK